MGACPSLVSVSDPVSVPVPVPVPVSIPFPVPRAAPVSALRTPPPGSMNAAQALLDRPGSDQRSAADRHLSRERLLCLLSRSLRRAGDLDRAIAALTDHKTASHDPQALDRAHSQTRPQTLSAAARDPQLVSSYRVQYIRNLVGHRL